VQVESPVVRKDLKEKLRRIKRHRVGIGQQGLSQLDIGIPERPFSSRISLRDQVFQWIMEVGDISNEISAVRKNRVIKEEKIQKLFILHFAKIIDQILF